MKRSILSVLFISLVWISFGQETSNKRLALVIGNSNYEKGELKNPVKDATLIAKTLDSLNFDVILRTNLETDRDLKLAIREFGVKRSEYDVAFVYYAGHGIQVGNENYLLPTKEDFLSEDDVLEFAVSVQTIMKYLRGSGNKVNIMILDACRDNPFESSWNRTRSLKGRGLAKIPPPTGSLIAFSTDAGNVAPDGEGENSIYTTSLSRNMLLVDTSIDQVFRNVRAEVLEASDGLQRPVEATQLTGDVFYLNPSNYTDALVQIERIIEQENELEYQKSILVVENILSKYPNNTQANFLKGRLLFRLNYFDQAIAHYQKLVAQFGANVDYYLELFKNYYWKEEYEEAETQLENAIALDSKSARSYWTRGSLYEDKEMYDKALEDYNTAITLDSTNLNYWYARAKLFNYILEDPKSALQDYFKISTLDKDSTFAKNEYLYLDIGGIYEYDIKDLQKAVVYYTKEIEISPEFSLGFRNRAHVYQKLKQDDKALEDYTEAIRLDPEEAKNFQMRADFFYEQTKYREALEDYNQAIALEENNMELLYARALLYQEGLNDYENALKDYFRITSIDQDNSFAKNNYLNNNVGVIYQYEFGDLEKALVYYTKEIELSPEYSLGYRNRADVYHELEQDDKAITDYSRAISLAPNDSKNYVAIGNYYWQKEMYENALKNYTTAIEIDPNNTNELENKAMIFAELNQYEKAVSIYKKIIEKLTEENWIESYYHQKISELYQKIGDYESALKFIEKSLSVYGEDEDIAIDVLSEIYITRGTIYMNTNKMEQARADYLKAISLVPEDRNPYFYLVNFYIKNNDPSSALVTIDKTIAMDYNDPDGFYKKAKVYFNDKQYINSLISISNAILKSEENDRLVKGDYYIQDLDNLGQISLTDLYLFRSKVLMKLEYDQKACEDLYNALLKKTTQNEADTIQTMLQKNCL